MDGTWGLMVGTTGSDFARLQAVANASTPADSYWTLEQKVSATTATIAANTSYQLAVDLGVSPQDGAANRGTNIALWAWNETTSKGTFISDLEVAASTINASLGNFATYTTTATAPDSSLVGEQLYVKLTTRFGTSQDFAVALDNVVITAAVVPEPTTLMLVATGVVGLLAYAWRKRKCVPS